MKCFKIKLCKLLEIKCFVPNEETYNRDFQNAH